MKKDMGGAATMLALAHMLMDRGIKLRLRVLIPAVENAISGSAFRPRDVYRSRKGLTVEIGNTDAEGRLILADAMALADEEQPELIADMATLTGAARVALGHRAAAVLHRGRGAGFRAGALRGDRERSALADAAVAALRAAARVQGGGHQQRFLRATSAARSPPRCSCAASSPRPKPGCIATSMPGTRPPGRAGPEGGRVPGGTRALCIAGRAAMAERETEVPNMRGCRAASAGAPCAHSRCNNTAISASGRLAARSLACGGLDRFCPQSATTPSGAVSRLNAAANNARV